TIYVPPTTIFSSFYKYSFSTLRQDIGSDPPAHLLCLGSRCRTLHFYDSFPIKGNNPGFQRDDIAFGPGIPEDRNTASPFDRLEKCTLRTRTDFRRRVIHPLRDCGLLFVIQFSVTFNRNGALSDSRNEVARCDLLYDEFVISGSVHAGIGKDQRVEISVLHFLKTCLQVSPRGDDFGMRIEMTHERHAPGRGSAH